MSRSLKRSQRSKISRPHSMPSGTSICPGYALKSTALLSRLPRSLASLPGTLAAMVTVAAVAVAVAVAFPTLRSRWVPYSTSPAVGSISGHS